MLRLFLILLFLSLCFPCNSFAAETVEPLFVDISLNQSPKGSLLVLASPDENYWLSGSDLDSLGLSYDDAAVTNFEGDTFYSIAAITGLNYEFDTASVTLKLSIDPNLLPRQSLDISNRQRQNVLRPRDNSLFLNYALSHTSLTNPDISETSFSNELGGRNGNWLFLSNSLYRSGDQESSFRRLMTRAIHDNRETLNRTTVGDQYFATGPLGGQGIIGGVGFEKLYTMEPNIKKYPGVFYSGVAETPSEVEIYLDGNRIHREYVEPGTFEINHLNRFGGAGDLEVVIRDSFGTERREFIPFYVEEQLLRAGEHEFSYLAGMLREKFATDDDSYEDGALTASHDYGFRRNWTLGYRAEIGASVYNLAPRVLWNTKSAGSLELILAGSMGEESNGSAQAFSHNYRARMFSTSFTLRNFSKDYSHLSSGVTTERVKTSAEFGIGFTSRALGSINLKTLFQAKHSGQDESSYILALNRQIARNVRISSNLNVKDQTNESVTDFYIGISYTPKPDYQLSVISESRDDIDSQTVMWQKNTPSGEGYGYRVEVASQQRGNDTLAIFSPSAQYNGRYASLRGNYDWETGGSEDRHSLNATVAGALAVLGGKPRVTRPIRDSYALIKVGDLEGVKVYNNAQLIGRTASDGTILSPSLNSFYNNRLSIDDQDIPIDFSLPAVEKFVAPPYRSGSCFVFETRKFQPVTGKLLLRKKNGDIVALENLEVTLSDSDEVFTLESGKDGEFYFEPGSPKTAPRESGCETLASRVAQEDAPAFYVATFHHLDSRYSFNLNIPASDELFIDLGDVIVEAAKKQH